MILGHVSWLDCIVFLVFLAPQLIIHAGFFGTLSCGLRALPFLAVKLPLALIYERLFVRRQNRTPFVQNASWFEDLVIRCVRYAFAEIPSRIGWVFFAKPVALPFLRFRMLRHGYLFSPIHWHEVNHADFRGIWIIRDKTQEPDIVIYYVHGGGFSMGSSYFYLEFLLVWLSLLESSGFRNPAIFTLEYTLVGSSPLAASYPTQLRQTVAGYQHVLSIAHGPSKVCVSGDSAGANLILSLLLHLAIGPNGTSATTDLKETESIIPEYAVLISPWVMLISPNDRNNPSDYLDADTLHIYARQYAGTKISIDDPLVSPGNCKEADWWKKASPPKGFFITYGSEEVFAPEIRNLTNFLKDAKVPVEANEESGGVHVWPVAALFLSSTREARQKGLRKIVAKIRSQMMN